MRETPATRSVIVDTEKTREVLRNPKAAEARATVLAAPAVTHRSIPKMASIVVARIRRELRTELLPP